MRRRFGPHFAEVRAAYQALAAGHKGFAKTVRDLFPNDWKPRLSRFLLDLDARVDSGVFHAGRWARELYERYSTFMDRFHVARWKRAFVEVTSDGMNMGTLGLILMLALAIPAFRETLDDNWLKKGGIL